MSGVVSGLRLNSKSIKLNYKRRERVLTPLPNLKEIELSLETALLRIEDIEHELQELRHNVGKSYGAILHLAHPEGLPGMCDDCEGVKHE